MKKRANFVETLTCQSHSDLNFRKGKIANLFTQIIFINLIGWFPSPQMRGKRKDVERGEQGGEVPCQGRGEQLVAGKGQSGLRLQLRELCALFSTVERAFAGGGAM